MATSAADVSPNKGAKSAEPFKAIQTILGLNMGASMVSDVAFEKRESCFLKLLPYFIEVFRIAPLLTAPIVYFSGAGDSVLVPIGVLVFFSLLILLTLLAVMRTGNENPGCLEKSTRWLLVHIPFCRYVRDLLNINNTGPVQRIVVVNGGYTVPDNSYGNDLLHALELAREKLNCYFLGLDGRDVIADIKDKFVKRAPGQQPRWYKFRVDYYDRETDLDKDRKVGEGEVILIAPRHPDKGVNTNQHVAWKEALRDINVDLEAELWGTGPDLEAAEVDRLTFCCCECCHDKPCCGISKLMCGVFPQHVTANQFFTPTMFSVYHREGYRACVEANAAEFLGIATSVEMRPIIES